MYRKKYKLVRVKQLWGEHRAYYFDSSGKLLAIPINWTTLRKSDPFREISRGRAYFKLNDLLELCEVVKYLKDKK